LLKKNKAQKKANERVQKTRGKKKKDPRGKGGQYYKSSPNKKTEVKGKKGY